MICRQRAIVTSAETPASVSAISRRSVGSATGSIAGARSERGNSRPTVCMAASAGVRGAKVKTMAPVQRSAMVDRVRTMSCAW